MPKYIPIVMRASASQSPSRTKSSRDGFLRCNCSRSSCSRARSAGVFWLARKTRRVFISSSVSSRSACGLLLQQAIDRMRDYPNLLLFFTRVSFVQALKLALHLPDELPQSRVVPVEWVV